MRGLNPLSWSLLPLSLEEAFMNFPLTTTAAAAAVSSPKQLIGLGNAILNLYYHELDCIGYNNRYDLYISSFTVKETQKL